MVTSTSHSVHRSASRILLARSKNLSRIATRGRALCRSIHPAWIVCLVLLCYIFITSLRARLGSPLGPALLSLDREQDVDVDAGGDAASANSDAEALVQQDDLMRHRRNQAALSHLNSSAVTSLGNHFCVLQPTLSSGRKTWSEADARKHIALRAFLRTFATTVTPSERSALNFSIYYGHDSDDPVFGEGKLRAAFADEGRKILHKNGFADDDVKFIFTPLYGLHGRINAIWNILAKDAYYDGCDYFFLSNDDMVFFTRGWVSTARNSLNGIGAPTNHKRPCRYFGIVRFKDEWASWATFTFHVSTRMHLEIFGGVYYPVPYESAHNDYWINFVYRQFDASKYRGEVKVRNRVDDVDYALAHPKDQSKIAPPRYTYDKRGNARKHILQGRARVQAWLNKNRHTPRCPPPL